MSNNTSWLIPSVSFIYVEFELIVYDHVSILLVSLQLELLLKLVKEDIEVLHIVTIIVNRKMIIVGNIS